MKIIKKGTKITLDKKVYITKCRVCGCKFTYMEKDIGFSIFPISHYFIECPQCSYEVLVPTFKKKYKGGKE